MTVVPRALVSNNHIDRLRCFAERGSDGVNKLFIVDLFIADNIKPIRSINRSRDMSIRSDMAKKIKHSISSMARMKIVSTTIPFPKLM